MKDILKMKSYVVARLKAKGFIVQGYESITTNSVYLKLDYGMSNSIRISDHKGKKGLSYRYNLLNNRENYSKHKTHDGNFRYYYPFEEVDRMIEDIIRHKKNKIVMFGRKKYKRLMLINYEKNKDKKGFWEGSKIL